MEKKIIILGKTKPEETVTKKANDFVENFRTLEEKNKVPLILNFDERSKAFYVICHIDANTLAHKCDLDAVLDPEESEDYKMNRNLYIDTSAYKSMEADAINGRSFEDIVVEYDTFYKSHMPLKVFGGQHRITAIKKAISKAVTVFHGLRVYFDLSVNQKFDIAIANNTSIAVANDLLDRMQEELLGSDLRDWCQTVGLLSKGENFADRRSPDGIITVRVARTLITNFYHGKTAKSDDYHVPIVCSSGSGIDKNYQKIRDMVKWSSIDLKKMGENFAKLHNTQRNKVLARDKDNYLEFANKAIHPTVAACYSYAAGLFQKDQDALNAHYGLSDVGGTKDDPLNAKALSKARLEPTDPDTYRGLGARINNEESGRMLAVFIVQATKAKKKPGITLELANAAIKTYQAAKTAREAEKAIKRI